jgi:hypothetical protein
MKSAALCQCLLILAPLLAAKEPFKPNLGPDRPSITVRCGEVTLMLRQSSQWTPGRIDFRGTAMTTEKSAYGTVFSFPEIGFIGTNHLENEPEPLTSLAFFLDGKPLADPAAELSGNQFRFVRESTIRDFELRCEVEIKDGRVLETTTVRTEDAVPLKLVYHFMHAWTPTVDAWLAGSDSKPDEVLSGRFADTPEEARKFHIRDRVDWIAVREPGSGQFAVSRLLEAPEVAENVSMIWNVPGTYRKYYLKCFDGDTVPAGFTGTWKLVTGFGTSGAGEWEGRARALAAELAKAK